MLDCAEENPQVECECEESADDAVFFHDECEDVVGVDVWQVVSEEAFTGSLSEPSAVLECVLGLLDLVGGLVFGCKVHEYALLPGGEPCFHACDVGDANNKCAEDEECESG